MKQVTFTDNLARHHQVTPVEFEAETVGDLLIRLLERYPQLRGYLFDDQHRLRPHIMLAIDQRLVQGDLSPFLEVSTFQRLHIMQALSGG